MVTLLVPGHVEALMASGLDVDDLIKVIEREEDWLANDPVNGIGQLVGARTVTIWVTPGEDRPLLLTRPTAAAAVEDAGVVVDPADIALIGGLRIERVGSWTGPTVEVTFTPSDQAAIERVLIELVRLAISASPFNQESSEGHSYTRPADVETARARLARSLRPHRGPMSSQLGSGLVSGRIT